MAVVTHQLKQDGIGVDLASEPTGVLQNAEKVRAAFAAFQKTSLVCESNA